MSDLIEGPTVDLVGLTADLVSAYVSNNSVPIAEVPQLLQGVHAALTGLANGAASSDAGPAVERLSAAQIRKSITPSGIVSFVDGKTYQTLKRHLIRHGLAPETYRAKFGLPHDYPMVCPDYAARRSELAKSIGLGRVAGHGETSKPELAEEPVLTQEVKPRGRKKKAA